MEAAVASPQLLWGAVGVMQMQPNTNPMGQCHSMTGQHDTPACHDSVCPHPQASCTATVQESLGVRPNGCSSLEDLVCVVFQQKPQ